MSDHLSIAGTALEYFHVCAFFNSRDEEYDVLTPFFAEGVQQGEKNVHIVDPCLMDEHRARLSAAGIDASLCEACGLLEILPWRKAYLDEQGVFDKDRMLATLDAMTTSVPDGAYRRLRIMGNMAWALHGGAATPEKLIEYEAEVNDVLSRNRQPAVCVYDVSKLSGAMMMDLLRTHPLTIIGGVVQENPFYTPPAQMLRELRAREQPAPSAAA